MLSPRPLVNLLMGSALLLAVVAAPAAHAENVQIDPTRNAVSLQYGASGVTPVTCTLNTTTTTCGPFTPVAGRPFHISHMTASFTAACQVERKTDGTNWAIETVTAAGSSTQMGNWSFGAQTQASSEDFEETQASVPYQFHCTSVSAGSDTMTFSQ